jgi:PAS domain S-box-containing protein
VRIWPVAALIGFAASPSLAEPLRTASQVKRVTLEESRREPAVTLRGVVTHLAPEWNGFSLQDATEAVYIGWSAGVARLSLGQIVEVRGRIYSGNFAPAVKAEEVRVVGTGGMPVPAKASWENLASGACDNNYVELTGVVRSARPVAPPKWSWPALELRIDIGGNVARVLLRDTGPPPARLLDATVRVRGTCLEFANTKRQFIGGAISVARPGDLVVERPGPDDPFDAPLKALNALFGFTPDGRAAVRTRVSGIATAQVPGGIYIQIGGDGILVRADLPTELRPGDRVEAVGYPTAGESSAVLEDAVARVTGAGKEPAPLAVEPGNVLHRVSGAPAAPDGVLVRMAATVLDWTPTMRDESLMLEHGVTTFVARLPGSAKERRLSRFRPGSRVAVTGVCVVHTQEEGASRSFVVLLRSPADVETIAGPPLSQATALRVAGLLLGGLAATAIWLAMLRRRVARQTETIRTQLRREAALEQRYTALAENASDPIYVRDLQGRLLQVNRGTEELTGYTREELLGMNVVDLMAPDERERGRSLLAAAGEQQAGVREWRVRTKQGKEVVVEVKARVLRDEGLPARVECIARDITARHEAQSASLTERRQLEEQLRQSQKMESIGLLAGGVAHDFNNLLTVISGYAQMAREEVPEPHPARAAIDEIAQAADRAAGLTRQLLTFSRRQMTSPTVVSVNKLIGNMEMMLRRLIGEDIELTLSLRSKTGATLADAGHLEQVVMNLAINARDAMPQGGRLTIETTDVEAAGGEGAPPRPLIELCVCDTGSGVPPEVRERIFEPFFTTKEKGKGTGLGLSVVYGIVKQSGGAITVESEPGKGSRFRLLLPAVAAAPDAVDAPTPFVDGQQGHETILVAEDEEGVRGFVSNVLRSGGYTVLEAANGREALEIAGRRLEPIHLLLSDVVMPEVGGVELAERFSVARPEAAVLMMTGYTDRPLPPEIADAILMKPFTPTGLLGRVRQALIERKQPS